MIDLHCHILPGIDDGPADIEASLEMARAHVARGTTTVVATPHVSWDYVNRAVDIADATEELQLALRANGIPLTVLPGAEVALTRAVDLQAEELQALRLGGSPWLLLEAPISVDSPGLEGMIGMVQARGVRVLLAHPERCAAFHSDPELLERLVRAGCLAQLTATALSGMFGRRVQALGRQFLDAGLIHVVSSDAHDTLHRAPGMREQLADAGYAPLTDWLTQTVPEALLSGTPVPERPAFEAPKVKRRFGRWR